MDKSWTAWVACYSVFTALYILFELTGLLSGCSAYRGVVAGLFFSVMLLGSIWVYYFKNIPLSTKISRSGMAMLFAIGSWHLVMPSFSLAKPAGGTIASNAPSTATLAELLDAIGFEFHPPDLGWPESALLIIIVIGITCLAFDWTKILQSHSS